MPQVQTKTNTAAGRSRCLSNGIDKQLNRTWVCAFGERGGVLIPTVRQLCILLIASLKPPQTKKNCCLFSLYVFLFNSDLRKSWVLTIRGEICSQCGIPCEWRTVWSQQCKCLSRYKCIQFIHLLFTNGLVATYYISLLCVISGVNRP